MGDRAKELPFLSEFDIASDTKLSFEESKLILARRIDTSLPPATLKFTGWKESNSKSTGELPEVYIDAIRKQLRQAGFDAVRYPSSGRLALTPQKEDLVFEDYLFTVTGRLRVRSRAACSEDEIKNPTSINQVQISVLPHDGSREVVYIRLHPFDRELMAETHQALVAALEARSLDLESIPQWLSQKSPLKNHEVSLFERFEELN